MFGKILFQNFSSLQFIYKFCEKILEGVVFQNFSSLQFIYMKKIIEKMLIIISKLFKFTVHKIFNLLIKVKNFISKLFKFTVHLTESERLKGLHLFQNFSSLQFISQIHTF